MLTDMQYQVGFINAAPLLRILDAEGERLAVFTATQRKMISRWRSNGLAEFDCADRFFAKIGLTQEFFLDEELAQEYARVNLDRMVRGAPVGPPNRDKTHCLRGHPLSGENLLPRRDGKRMCAACNRRRSATSRAKRVIRRCACGTKFEIAAGSRKITCSKECSRENKLRRQRLAA